MAYIRDLDTTEFNAYAVCETDPMSHMNLVIGVGAARSGTTWLWRCLDAHPDVHMSHIKETNYFSHDLIGVEGPQDRTTLPELGTGMPELDAARPVARIQDARAYKKLLFDQTSRYCGEVSPSYLYFAATVAPRIRSFNDKARIIILLREPAARALSTHDLFSRSGREPLPFGAALAAEESRMAQGWEHGWGYAGLGFYHEAVTTYLDVFGREQVWIGLYEDLARSPAETFHSVCDFLGIRRTDPATTSNVNRGKDLVGPLTRLSRTGLGMRARAAIPPSIRRAIRADEVRRARNRRFQDPTLQNELAQLRRQVFATDVRKLDRLLPELNIMGRWGY